MLTPDEIKQVLILISRADIKGAEALSVATLMQKLAKMAQPQEESKEE